MAELEILMRSSRCIRRSWSTPALAVLLWLPLLSAPASADYVLFESGPVRPLALSSDGLELYATNIPDGELEIFDVTESGLVKTASVQVGLEPVAVAVASDGNVWVVNHLSDSVSIVDPTLSPPAVVQTLIVGDEPRDIVFAGDTTDRAFITTAHRGQHRLTIPGAIGGGDPQFLQEGIGRADVWVFDVGSPGTSLGGDPVEIMTFFTDTPRALAVSNNGAAVYVAGFHSGNQTTTVLETFICDSFNPAGGCLLAGVLPLPAGMEGPSTNVGPPAVSAPFTGAIVKFNNSTGNWENGVGTNMNTVVPFNLPDNDVFVFSADLLSAGGVSSWDRVGTILFNMAVHPVSDKLYVSNTESPNHVLFEGAGGGGSTVQGKLSLSQISILSGGPTVDIRHLNKHIDYTKLHTDVPDLVDPTQKDHSLATPLEMVFSSDGSTLYVAAFGSGKVGVFDTTTLENDTFDPTVESANYIDTGGGPSGLILDEANDRLYVMTRFDNSVAVIDLGDNSTLQTVPIHNPESPTIVAGRPFLYDALNFSGNGEASCASCHIFGDNDSLGWNLGDPDGAVTSNTQPAVPGSAAETTFHPMKGPMTTQTLRGMASHGALHWRGDRVDGIEGLDPCTEPTGAPCSEEHSFLNFRPAFEGLIGMDSVLSNADMQLFTDFALLLTLPPNPVRALDNTLSVAEQAGLTLYFAPGTDGVGSCNDCHRLDRSRAFFGSGGEQTFEGETQNFKVAHLRNMYTKVGMFGKVIDPDTVSLAPHTGDQIRGFGFLHDGAVDTTETFLSSMAFPSLSQADEEDLTALMMAFDSDLAPMVGQQVTLDSSNGATVGGRIAQMITSASTSFVSPVIGASLNECDLIVSGHDGAGAPRGWLYRPPPDDDFLDDTGGTLSDSALRALVGSQGPLTYSCVPPGSGLRMGINRDRDIHHDGVDNCPDAHNDVQTDTDGDTSGDACDQDDDNDTLLDVYETGTGVFNSPFDTGTDPLLTDTDGDSFDDDVEIASGTDPNNASDSPATGVPALSLFGLLVLGGALGFSAWFALRRNATGTAA